MSLYPFNPNHTYSMQGASAAVPVVRHRFVAHLQVTPAAASATGVHAAIALTASPQTNYTTGFPVTLDVARNVTAKGNASGITGNVVVYGTDLAGTVISETIALSGSSEVAGNYAFATVTKVDLPAETHAGTDTVSIGHGSKLGLRHKLTHNTVIFAFLANTKEGTAPTVAVSSSALKSNTATLNSSLNGSVVDVYYLV